MISFMGQEGIILNNAISEDSGSFTTISQNLVPHLKVLIKNIHIPPSWNCELNSDHLFTFPLMRNCIVIEFFNWITAHSAFGVTRSWIDFKLRYSVFRYIINNTLSSKISGTVRILRKYRFVSSNPTIYGKTEPLEQNIYFSYYNVYLHWNRYNKRIDFL